MCNESFLWKDNASPFRSLPQQSSPVCRHSSMASGHHLQHQQSMLSLPNSRGDAGWSGKFQWLNVSKFLCLFFQKKKKKFFADLLYTRVISCYFQTLSAVCGWQDFSHWNWKSDNTLSLGEPLSCCSEVGREAGSLAKWEHSSICLKRHK